MSPLFNPYIQIKQKKTCVLQGVTRQTFARPVTTWSFTVTLPSNRWQIIQKVRWQLNISQNVTLFLEELVFRFKNIQMENTLFDLRDLGVNAGPDCPVITHDWLHTPTHQHNFQSVHGVQQCVGKMDSTEKRKTEESAAKCCRITDTFTSKTYQQGCSQQVMSLPFLSRFHIN